MHREPPLQTTQEILLRHLHKTVRDYVDDHERTAHPAPAHA